MLTIPGPVLEQAGTNIYSNGVSSWTNPAVADSFSSEPMCANGMYFPAERDLPITVSKINTLTIDGRNEDEFCNFGGGGRMLAIVQGELDVNDINYLFTTLRNTPEITAVEFLYVSISKAAKDALVNGLGANTTLQLIDFSEVLDRSLPEGIGAKGISKILSKAEEEYNSERNRNLLFARFQSERSTLAPKSPAELASPANNQSIRNRFFGFLFKSSNKSTSTDAQNASHEVNNSSLQLPYDITKHMLRFLPPIISLPKRSFIKPKMRG